MPDSVIKPKLPIAETFEAAYLEQWGILPLELISSRLTVAAAGEPPGEVLDDLRDSYQAELDFVPVTREELLEAIRRVYGAAESVVAVVKDLGAELGMDGDLGNDEVADARDLANQKTIVKFVNLLIKEAHAARASDVHLESTRDGLRTRYRIDGVLVDAPSPPKGVRAAVVSRVKLLAQLDIAERRVPQDGRIRVLLEERELDLRVSTIPTLSGESVVLRLLDRGGQPVALGDLGMDAESLATFQRLAQRPHGILLATGPTGSGKTTTLYAALGLRRAKEEKIVTVEDPVEYHLDNVTQMQINTKAGTTFGMALRSVLRQDPDVLMIGEVRDAETAAIAVQSALTGHLVFSTLHTNDAAGAMTRLADLKVEPYLIPSTVQAVLAQRLVRRLCSQCRVRYKPDPAVVALIASGPVGRITLERGTGCETCRGTGYQGRTGIYELLVMSDETREVLHAPSPPSSATIREIALAQGMITLKQDGWRKVQAGITTVEEVMRVVEH